MKRRLRACGAIQARFGEQPQRRKSEAHHRRRGAAAVAVTSFASNFGSHSTRPPKQRAMQRARKGHARDDRQRMQQHVAAREPKAANSATAFDARLRLREPWRPSSDRSCPTCRGSRPDRPAHVARVEGLARMRARAHVAPARVSVRTVAPRAMFPHAQPFRASRQRRAASASRRVIERARCTRCSAQIHQPRAQCREGTTARPATACRPAGDPSPTRQPDRRGRWPCAPIGGELVVVDRAAPCTIRHGCPTVYRE